MDDEILIVDDEKVDSNRIKQGWKVLIVDDEPEVHRITKMTLAKFEFDNKPIEFIHAYTGREAKAIVTNETANSTLKCDTRLRSSEVFLEHLAGLPKSETFSWA